MFYFILGMSAIQNVITPQASEILQRVYDKAADDAIDRYWIVAKHGSKTDQCVQAMIVTATLLQARHEEEYAKWKIIEAGDCNKR